MDSHRDHSYSLMQSNMKHKVILFPLPFQGHLNPMFQLAKILHSKGLSITIIHTIFNSPNPKNYPFFEFYPISDGLSKDDRDRPSTEDAFSLIPFFNISCIAPFKDCLAKLSCSNNVVGDKEESRVCCLITDADWPFTQDVANDLKIRRIVLRTSSIFSFLAFVAFPLLEDKGYLSLEESLSESELPELPPLRVKDIPVVPTHPNILHDFIPNMVKKIKASSGCIWNTFQELEESAVTQFHHDFQIPTFLLGPFHKYFPASNSLLSQDTTSISWLDKQAPKSVLYVSFGSVAAITATDFVEIAFGLANSKVPFLWVVRPGLVRGHETKWLELLPEGFCELVGTRGHIVKWAPQQDVLAHNAIGGFWTHCGWNSTLESVCEGVPMICQPFFGDQLVNARYVSHVWRAGVHLEGKMERKEIETVIRRVILEDEGMEMRKRIMGLKEKMDLGLKEGGSSYKSLESLVNYIISF